MRCAGARKPWHNAGGGNSWIALEPHPVWGVWDLPASGLVARQRFGRYRAHAYIEANGLFGVEPSGPIAGNLADGQEARSLGAAFIRKAESVMNKNDLGLDGSTPQTVTSESCPELFERVGKIMGVDVESCTLKCDVSTIVSETVRGNHVTYTYLVTYMDAVIDGVEVIYENGTYSIA